MNYANSCMHAHALMCMLIITPIMSTYDSCRLLFHNHKAICQYVFMPVVCFTKGDEPYERRERSFEESSRENHERLL